MTNTKILGGIVVAGFAIVALFYRVAKAQPADVIQTKIPGWYIPPVPPPDVPLLDISVGDDFRFYGHVVTVKKLEKLPDGGYSYTLRYQNGDTTSGIFYPGNPAFVKLYRSLYNGVVSDFINKVPPGTWHPPYNYIWNIAGGFWDDTNGHVYSIDGTPL